MTCGFSAPKAKLLRFPLAKKRDLADSRTGYMRRLGTRGRIPRSVAERVADKVIIDAASGCHVWQGATNGKAGYPQIKAGSTVDGTSRPYRVYRLLWDEAHGSLPDGMSLHHTCENKLCVNLEHIAVMTNSEHVRFHHRHTYRKPRGPNRTRYAHVCSFCGEDYQANRRDQRYCTTACRARAFRAKL